MTAIKANIFLSLSNIEHLCTMYILKSRKHFYEKHLIGIGRKSYMCLLRLQKRSLRLFSAKINKMCNLVRGAKTLPSKEVCVSSALFCRLI